MKEAEDLDDSQDFYQELEEQELATLKKHIRGRKGSRNSRNNSATEVLYKQALLDSIFGRFQEASKKLKHMITLSPDSPEPYHLLGNMHEQNGELDKAVEYLFMSTYLSPPNLEKWLKVGDLSFELKMFNQAAYCYGRALKIASCDPKIMVRRAQAFELAGQSKKAVATYKRLLTISQSPEYVKKYAKLRYKRGEYLLCRQILQALDNYILDVNIVYMICETYLQQHSYEQAAKTLEHHLQAKSQTMQEQQMLPSEFIVILFICSVVLNRECYGFNAQTLLEQIKSCYDDDYVQLYSDAISHISKHSEHYAYELASFLIKYPHHQNVSNYIMVIDYLCRKNDKSCLGILDCALKIYPHSPELLAERDYVHKCFGIGITLKQAEAIFYSDEDQSISFAEHVPPPKKNSHEHTDNQVMERIIQNVEESLALLIQQINKGGSPGLKQQQAILDGLDLFISLAPGGREDETQQRQGLYIKKGGKRRNNQGEGKVNLINEHMTTVMKYFENLVLYLQGLLSTKQWRKIIQIGEKVSKVHMFKNHSKNTDFIQIKIAIYEICTLSCLAVNKFNTSIFFLRFLVTRHPEDSLYALSMHLLMKICSKKTFLSSALGKRLNNPGGEHLARLLAVEYMETGCFDLAISAILRSSHNKQYLGSTSQLCLSACLIQIASSRNTFNKLDFTNRSAVCLASYEGVVEDKWEGLFNRGRWYAQVKVNIKAIQCFQEIVNSSQANQRIKERAAYCLIYIYRECDQYQKSDELSRDFFPIPEVEQANDVIVQ